MTGPVGGTGEGTEVLTVLVAEHSTRLSRLLLGLDRRFGLHTLVFKGNEDGFSKFVNF